MTAIIWICSEISKHYELSEYYSTYMKKYVNFMSECNILTLQLAKLPEFLKEARTTDVFWIYEHLEELMMITLKVK